MKCYFVNILLKIKSMRQVNIGKRFHYLVDEIFIYFWKNVIWNTIKFLSIEL